MYSPPIQQKFFDYVPEYEYIIIYVCVQQNSLKKKVSKQIKLICTWYYVIYYYFLSTDSNEV